MMVALTAAPSAQRKAANLADRTAVRWGQPLAARWAVSMADSLVETRAVWKVDWTVEPMVAQKVH